MRPILLLAALAACGAPERIVPVVDCACDALDAGAAVVTVTREGSIRFEGADRSVNELMQRVDPAVRVALRADRSACWMHVQWVMAALGEAGFRVVDWIVDSKRSDSTGAFRVPVYPGRWEERIGPPLDSLDGPTRPFGGVLAVIWTAAGARFGWTEGWYSADVSIEPTRDPAALARGVAASARAAGTRPVRLTLEASGRVPFHAVVDALAACRAARVDPDVLDVGLESLHPWDRDLRVLPPPRSAAVVYRWWATDWSIKSVPTLNLPVAASADEDRDDDPDDRLVFSLTATGTIIFGEQELSLAGVAERLETAKARCREKLRRLGKEECVEGADGARWSRLYVLVRADRDAAWRHVRWILAELAQARIYRIQFGVRTVESRILTSGEMGRRWAGRDIDPPGPLGGKLVCFQSTGGSRDGLRLLEVRVRADEPRFGVAAAGDALEAWLKTTSASWPPDEILGRIAADAGVRVGPVVAALDRFHRLRIERIDFSGVVRAPAALRTAAPLPGGG